VTPARSASTMRPVAKKAEVSKVAGKKVAKPARIGVGVPPSNQPPRKSRRKERAALRRRLPRTAAVGLSVAPVGDGGAPSLAEILRRARTEIPNATKAFGNKTVRPRRMATGSLLLEIPGAEALQRADQMATRLRKLFPVGSSVRISHPVKRVDLRITGFDESVTPEEITVKVSHFADGFTAEDVRVGAIRSSRNGLCTVWVQAPAAVGVPLAERGG